MSDTEFIHIFKNNGTFTPSRILVDAKVLVIGGGGSGGYDGGGGGGPNWGGKDHTGFAGGKGVVIVRYVIR